MRTRKQSELARVTHSLRGTKRRLIKTQKESKLMRDTHFLKRTEGGTGEDTQRQQPRGAFTFWKR